MSLHSPRLLFALLALLATACPALAREWSDKSGRFRIEADLVEQTASAVILREANGRKLKVPLSSLSDADLRYLVSLKKTAPASPAVSTPPPGQRTNRVQPSTTTLVRGLEIISHDASGTGILGSLAVPAEWPEQSVKVGETRKSTVVKRVAYKQLAGGSKLMTLSVPRLRPRSNAKVEVDFEVTRRPIALPADTASFKAPASPSAALRPYLSSSPGINLTHPDIVRIAKEIAATGGKDWQLARAIYDWVKKNLKYTRGKLRGAVWATQHGEGDCEEYTSLFIALARVNGIPARVVWVPGHCYPEFYLENKEGGRWFPCDPLSTDEFGASTALKPILQKGDNFADPGKSTRRRYLAETIQGSLRSGGRQPEVKAILRSEK